MKKVFWKCIKTVNTNCSAGKEYQELNGAIIDDNGLVRPASDLDRLLVMQNEQIEKYGAPAPGWSIWQRIERDCFEANGHEWFRHTPGDPMPCDPHAQIVAHYRDGFTTSLRGNWAENFRWNAAGAKEDPACDIIGWRFADSAQTSGPEPQTSGANLRTCDDETPDRFPDFAWLEFLKLAAPDVAAVEDTSLPPRHRKIFNAKVDEQAEREDSAKEALAKSEQEKSDQLKRDGEALSRDFDNLHDPRMGYPCATRVVKC